MNKTEKALREIQAMDELAAMDSPIHRLAPLAKLLVTVAYIFVTVSFSKYDMTGLLIMILYPVAGYQFSLIPVYTCFYKLRIVLPLVCAVGIFNPFFDRGIVMTLGTISVSGGVISMLTLLMKGVFCLMASFLLVATTSIEEICHALRQFHVPRILTSLLLLTWRYVSLLLEQVSIMTQSYHLRAPGQKGIHVSAWGSFLGQLILRSMDRAAALYESMELRGFHGDFYYAGQKKMTAASWMYMVVWIGLFILMRAYNLPQILGSLFV